MGKPDTTTAADRVHAYLDEHDKRTTGKNVDPVIIHGLGLSDQVLELTAPDLRDILADLDKFADLSDRHAAALELIAHLRDEVEHLRRGG